MVGVCEESSTGVAVHKDVVHALEILLHLEELQYLQAELVLGGELAVEATGF
jgi:hypothetical protein